ncbi:hypothetical protein QQ045_010250 [Rhodiola kirilowii]
MMAISGVSENGEVVRTEFPKFDVVTDFSDHRFADGKNENLTAGSTVYKRIMREWKILSENLPESIFVRTYETRIDLLRAVIIGAKGTPYHDGLFFFDIAFPKNYPNSPPKVHYRSYGYELSPIIFSDGYICLSILNNRPGKNSAAWNPSSSTVLQILVSLQALVLNEKAFYNETLFKPAWSSKRYNQKVFALNCKTMQSVLTNPPLNFKEFVIAHFSQRACSILKAIDAYKVGAFRVGQFDETQPYLKRTARVSKSFAREMKNLYDNMFSTFSAIAAPGLGELRLPQPEPAPNETADNSDVSSLLRANSTNKQSKESSIGKIVKKVKKIFISGLTKSPVRS